MINEILHKTGLFILTFSIVIFLFSALNLRAENPSRTEDIRIVWALIISVGVTLFSIKNENKK